MREFLGDKQPTSYSAGAVRAIENSRSMLGVEGKSLSEIHPSVSEDVVTDTKNDNFGRIWNKGTAENMARMRHGKWDGEPDLIADREVDLAMARNIEDDVKKLEGDKAGAKASEDYLITQGYIAPIHDRQREIRQDIHTRMVNPVAALADIVKSISKRKKNKVSH